MQKFILGLWVLTSFAKAQAQTEINLYEQKVPNTKPCAVQENNLQQGRVSGITNPKLYVYLPTVQDSSKAAVIICPGGGYARLAIGHEGYDVATSFAKKGIVAFVLKNRLPIDSSCFTNKEIIALQDAQQAIAYVKNHAATYNINPNLVGIMGFSAGGHLAATASTHYQTNYSTYTSTDSNAVKPAFTILGYPVITMKDSVTHKGSKENLLGKQTTAAKIQLYSNEQQVTKYTPPAFLVHAADDKAVPVENSLSYFQALIKNGVPAEIHVLQAGGHGFGMNNKAEPVNWMTNVFAWLKTNKWMKGNVE